MGKKKRKYDLEAAQNAIEKSMSDYLTNTPDNELSNRGKLAQEWKDGYERYVELKQFSTECDVLILTANQVEAITFLRLASENGNKPLPTIAQNNCLYHRCEIAGVKIVHVQTLDAGSDTEYGSRNATEAGIEMFHPQLVVSLGVAFGNNPEQLNLGDVIISKVLCCYGEKNKLLDDGVTIKPERFHCIDPLLQSVWVNPLSNVSYPSTHGYEFKWHFGTILSGESVVDCLEKKLDLIKACKDNNYDTIYGGEMEGYGAISVCRKASTPFVVVKGICDWAAGKNAWESCAKDIGKVAPDDINSSWNDFLKDGAQGLAMQNAYHAFELLLKHSSIPLITDRNVKASSTPSSPSPDNDAKSFSFLKSLTNDMVVALSLWVFSAVCFFTQAIVKFDSPPHQLMASIFTVVLFIATLFYTACVWKNKLLYAPFRTDIKVAEIRITQLCFRSNSCDICNMSDESLKNLCVSWVNKRQGVLTCNSVSLDEMNIGEEKRFDYLSASQYGKKCNCPFWGTVEPDMLQLEYDMNGNRICHVYRYGYNIAGKKKGSVEHFYEHVFLLKNDEYALLHKRKHEGSVCKL